MVKINKKMKLDKFEKFKVNSPRKNLTRIKQNKIKVQELK